MLTVVFRIRDLAELDLERLYCCCCADESEEDFFLLWPLKKLVNFDLILFHPSCMKDFLLAFWASFLFSKLWFLF